MVEWGGPPTQVSDTCVGVGGTPAQVVDTYVGVGSKKRASLAAGTVI